MLNRLSGGHDYTRSLFNFIVTGQLLNMLKAKRYINQQDIKIIDSHFVIFE